MAEPRPHPGGRLQVHLVHQSFGDYVAGLVSGFDGTPAGDDVELRVTTISTGSATLGRLRSAPGGHDHIQLPRFRDPRSPVEAFRAVRRVLARDCDVIHWQAAGSPWVDTAFSLLMGRRPTVVTVHDMVSHPGDANVLPGTFAAIGRLVRRADRVTVHAPHVGHQAMAAGADPAKVSVVAHGELGTRYAPPAELPLAPSGEPEVLFFGRAQGYKGLDVLVEAMTLVRTRVPSARLVVAGSGPSLDELFPAGEPLPAHCQVYRGVVPPELVLDLFRRAAVVALPYREASQSGVGALAAGLGRPVVASRVPGLTEMVSDGVTGLLVDPDDPPVLAEALVRMMTDDGLRLRLAAGAYEAASTHLAWPVIAEQLVGVYRAAADGPLDAERGAPPGSARKP